MSKAAGKPKRVRRRKYSSEPLAVVPPLESLGPAMRALTEKQRRFVMELREGPIGYGSEVRAARAAGYGTPTSTDNALWVQAHQTLHDPKVQEALREVGGKLIRAASFQSIRNVETIANDREHKDCLKANLALLDRGFPIETTHRVTVEKIDHTRQALDELRTLRRLQVPREKLIELYGADGLFHLERELDGSMKLIEGSVMNGAK
jgi:phage terminase small subunit